MAGTDLRGEPPPPRIEGSIDLWSAPSHLLRRCHQRAQELFKAALAPLGITAQQLSVLYALVEQPGLNQQRLAVVTGWDRNTLAAMLRRLAAQHWVERRRDPGDARSIPAGRRAKARGRRSCRVRERRRGRTATGRNRRARRPEAPAAPAPEPPTKRDDKAFATIPRCERRWVARILAFAKAGVARSSLCPRRRVVDVRGAAAVIRCPHDRACDHRPG